MKGGEWKMSFAEMKELAFMILFTILFAPVILYEIGYIFAKVTFIANKKIKKLQKTFYLINGGKLYV